MWRGEVLVRADVSEERIASIIKVKRISRLAKMLAVTSELLILLNIMMETKRRFLQEPHGVTSVRMAFFVVTAVKTSDVV
jgi:hypothetical protein